VQSSNRADEPILPRFALPVSEEVKDPQGGLSDQEFACLLMRSCGVSNLVGALGYGHANECGFCDGSKQVDPRSYRG
jgi:hypothetical protein